MADTIKRKVFYGKVNGGVAFFDWAVVSSVNGDFIEPFMCNNKFFNNDDTPIDPVEPTHIITDMVEMDINAVACLPYFYDGTIQWHGGPIRTKTF